jgi:hypothetical protein
MAVNDKHLDIIDSSIASNKAKSNDKVVYYFSNHDPMEFDRVLTHEEERELCLKYNSIIEDMKLRDSI